MSTPEPNAREAIVRWLEKGIGGLEDLRKKYGQHRDFDLCQRYQERLIARVVSGEIKPEELGL